MTAHCWQCRKQLVAVSTDTLVAGIHFLPDIDPADLGYKALAVNLSDLAAIAPIRPALAGTDPAGGGRATAEGLQR